MNLDVAKTHIAFTDKRILANVIKDLQGTLTRTVFRDGKQPALKQHVGSMLFANKRDHMWNVYVHRDTWATQTYSV